jgi:hypothetical protein
MFGKWSGAAFGAWAGLLLAGPASATVTYAFTSNFGDFVFTSPSFFEGGNIPGLGGVVISHSGDFDDVRFGNSDILLLNSTCEFDGNCFDATFLEDGIFQKTGTFFASEGDAKIVISGSPTGTPVPEPSIWALLMLGFAGLGLAGKPRHARRPRLGLRRASTKGASGRAIAEGRR